MKPLNPTVSDMIHCLTHFEGPSFFTRELALIDSILFVPEPQFAEKDSYESFCTRGHCQVELTRPELTYCLGECCGPASVGDIEERKLYCLEHWKDSL